MQLHVGKGDRFLPRRRLGIDRGFLADAVFAATAFQREPDRSAGAGRGRGDARGRGVVRLLAASAARGEGRSDGGTKG